MTDSGPDHDAIKQAHRAAQVVPPPDSRAVLDALRVLGTQVAELAAVINGDEAGPGLKAITTTNRWRINRHRRLIALTAVGLGLDLALSVGVGVLAVNVVHNADRIDRTCEVSQQSAKVIDKVLGPAIAKNVQTPQPNDPVSTADYQRMLDVIHAQKMATC